MYCYISIFLAIVCQLISFTVLLEIENCPRDCFCQWQHWKELSIMQFLQPEQELVDSAHYLYTNDATQFEDISNDDNNPLIKCAICVIQPNQTVNDLFVELPSDIESLTLIQASGEQTTTIYTSELNNLQFLKMVEIKGSRTFEHKFILMIDTPLKELSYLNVENIFLEGVGETSPMQLNFDEILQKLQFVPLTRQSSNHSDKIDEIVPYEVYKEQEKRKKMPMFKGFDNLLLLRVSGCQLNEIIWEMFDQLTKLRYLYLENNEIKIIPPFAFYGVPKLEILSLSKNHLLDINVSDLSGLLDLEYLDLSYNNFSQLSELSFPPFPKLKVADFRNNPINTIYPNTFAVMNTTKSIILGNSDTPIRLASNAFIGLNQLEVLKVYNLNSTVLNRDIFSGMKNLKELVLSGHITKIEFDTFIEMRQLQILILSNCHLQQLSMDAFIGLTNLQILDLSSNSLNTLPLGLFDPLVSIREIMLNNNNFTDLPQGLFFKIPAKLIRLNENPWDCTCHLMHWDPIVTNRIKYKTPKICRHDYDKGINCADNHANGAVLSTRYIYDRRVAPLCNTPNAYKNRGVFSALKKMHCFRNQRKLKLTKKVIDYIESGIEKTRQQSQNNQTIENILQPNTTHIVDISRKSIDLQQKLELINNLRPIRINKKYKKQKKFKKLAQIFSPDEYWQNNNSKINKLNYGNDVIDNNLLV